MSKRLITSAINCTRRGPLDGGPLVRKEGALVGSAEEGTPSSTVESPFSSSLLSHESQLTLTQKEALSASGKPTTDDKIMHHPGHANS